MSDEKPKMKPEQIPETRTPLESNEVGKAAQTARHKKEKHRGFGLLGLAEGISGLVRPDEKPKMKLEQIPGLLDQLKKNGSITEAQKESVLKLRKEDKYKGKFVGQIAVAEGMVKEEQINTALLAQVVAKGDAVEEDLANIAKHGRLDHPWLQASWGNNGGPNKATQQPSVFVAGTSAIANIAQNIVVHANDHHAELAKEKAVIDGVAAAARLTRFIAGESKERLSKGEAYKLRDQAMEALRKVAGRDRLFDKEYDPRKKPESISLEVYQRMHKVKLDDYIRERTQEINKGIAERLKAQEKSQAMPLDPSPIVMGLRPSAIHQR